MTGGEEGVVGESAFSAAPRWVRAKEATIPAWARWPMKSRRDGRREREGMAH